MGNAILMHCSHTKGSATAGGVKARNTCIYVCVYFYIANWMYIKTINSKYTNEYVCVFMYVFMCGQTDKNWIYINKNSGLNIL